MSSKVIDLTGLTPSQGFIIQGDSAGDFAGYSVSSAGDINGDGFSDLIVGAPVGGNGGPQAGEAYVIFGKAGATRANIDLTSLAASDGFIIQGDVAGDLAGLSVSSAGDINGDGFADMIVGAYRGDNGGYNAGEAYVIFGKAGATCANIDLTSLAASDGFLIQGDVADDRAGWSVSLAGDINGDGFADLIVGAPFGDNGGYAAGEAYVIFGKAGATRADIDLTSLAASDGFIIQGYQARDQTGRSVASAGDINGDGFADLIVGAPYGDNGGTNAGEAYVIFGKAGATRADIDLTSLAASDGFIIQGDKVWDQVGRSVSSADDINGDGFADLIVGAPDGNNGGDRAGEAYVIFGKAGATRANIDLTFLAASDGFIIQGDVAGDQAGWSASLAGDINGDGFGDLIVGAPLGDDGGTDAGEAYVIFGKAGATLTNIDLTSLAASDGFIIQGDVAGDGAGRGVSSAGDINGDGFADLIVGAPDGDNGGSDAGEAYVIYGRADIGRVNDAPTAAPVTLTAIAEESGARIITTAELLAGTADIDGPALAITAFTLTSGNGALVDNGNGTWSYTPAANDDTAAAFAYTVSDGSLSASSTASLDITPVNDAPVITSNGGGDTASVNVAEYTSAVTMVTSSDGDAGSSATYSIAGGADAAKFAINAATGALSFKDAPNFETPTDAGGNNVYDVIVRASDGTLFDEQAVKVSVQNAPEIYVGTNGDDVFTAPDTEAWTITGLVGNDMLSGNNGNDTIDGGLGNDGLTGSAGADIIRGDDGDDLLNGGTGNDTIDGGTGTDTATYADAATAVKVNLSLTAAQNTGAAGGTDRLISIENLIGSAFNDTLTGNSDDNVIDGLGGNNTLFGGAGNDMLVSGAGTDRLDGGIGVDTMTGGAGNDTYTVDNTLDVVTELVGGGTDAVNASATFTLSANVERLTLTGATNIDGTGNALDNTLTGNSGDNQIDGLDGNDKLTGNAGNDMLRGGAGMDTLNGGLGSDTLLGDEGNDRLDGGADADNMAGGLGDDSYTVDNIGDVVTENAGEGTDSVTAGVTFTLGANVEKLTLTSTGNIDGTGNELANTVTGNSGDNTISGLAGKDALSGGLGDDILIGGLGADTLTGGAGADRFRFDVLETTANKDTVKDFVRGTDVIELSRSAFSALAGYGAGALNANELALGTKATLPGQHLVYNAATGALFYDNDGSGVQAQVQIAVFTAKPLLDAGDFVLI